MKALRTKDYVKMAVTMQYNRGHAWTSIPVLQTIVGELMVRDGRNISKNLSKHVRDALSKRCPASPSFNGKEDWFDRNNEGGWGLYIGPGPTLEEYLFVSTENDKPVA